MRSLPFLFAVTTFLAVEVPAGPTHGAAQERSGNLSGMVFDAVTGSPVPGATVTLLHVESWTTVATAFSDEGGRFALSVRAGHFWLVASRSGFAASAPLEVEWGAGPGNVDGVLLEVRSLAPDALDVRSDASHEGSTARVLGRILDRDSGKPVADAEVELRAARLRTLTDRSGMFVFRDVPPGTDVLRVDHLAYGEEMRGLTLEPGQSYRVVGRVSMEPIDVEGIEVTATSRSWFRSMDGLRLRMERGLGGHFVLSDELERRGYPPLVEALRSAPGVDVQRAGLADWRVFMRHCSGDGPFPRQPVLYVDGIKIPPPDNPGEPFPILSEISSYDIEAIEVYRGGASVPAEYGGSDAGCGVIVIWSRRG